MLMLLVLLLPSTATDQNTNCDGLLQGTSCQPCRCLDRSFCHTGGMCLDYQCSPGWSGAPECQTPCSNSTFGVNCRLTCHCRNGSECDPGSGFCACHEEWGGAGCQTRLPKLVSAPQVGNISCVRMTVYWTSWRASDDVGEAGLKIHSYRVYVNINGSDELKFLPAKFTGSGRTEFTQVPVANLWSSYKFKIMTIWSEFEKPMQGLVGPWSPVVKPNDFCFDSTSMMETTRGTTPLSTTTLPSSTTPPPITTPPRATKMFATTWKDVFTTTTTPQTTKPTKVPPAPTNIRSSWSNESALALEWTWTSDDVEVIQYKINYATSGQDWVYILTGNNSTMHNLTKLSPDTSYNVRIEAQVSADMNNGWSVISEAATFRTEEGTPGPPVDLSSTWTNESCLQVEWKPPQFNNGKLTGFNISCQPLMPISGSTLQSQFKSSTDTYATFCDLDPGVLHKVTVTAQNRYRRGPQASTEVWTAVTQPGVPPPPVVLKVTNITVLLEIEPVKGSASGYYVAVNDSIDTAGRLMPYNSGSGAGLSMHLGPSYRFCAFLRPSEVLPGSNFTVGDGKNYGQFKNKVLEPDWYYSFCLVVENSRQKETKINFSCTEEAVRTLDYPISFLNSRLEQTKFTALGVSLVILLLALLALIPLVCCLRKKCKSEKDDEKVILEPASHSDYELNRKWSQIWTLGAFRHPLYYEESESSQESQASSSQPPISIKEEFYQLPTDATLSSDVALRAENRSKNRFDHILPYDHTRVKLSNNLENDYVNASFIHGSCKRGTKTYIASQSPFSPQTICDFWEMIHHNKISAVIFLSQLVEENVVKCEQYWPEDSYPHKYGNVFVLKEEIEKFANFVVRKFEVYSSMADDKSLVVRQYHFMSWNSSSHLLKILEFWRKVKSHEEANCWLVHCSTGVSRSGVFIALDICLRSIKRNKKMVNVYQTCLNMRRCRPYMVKSLKHYLMVYDLLYEALQVSHKEQFINRNNAVNLFDRLKRVNPQTKQTFLRDQFLLLEKLSPRPNDKSCSAGLNASNTSKNRFSALDLIPMDEDRVRLCNLEISSRSSDATNQDYINALFIDSYKRRHLIIVAQSPMPETLADFWRMIYETGSSYIVNMNVQDYTDDRYVSYAPAEGKQCLVRDKFVIESLDIQDYEHFHIQKLKFVHDVISSEDPRLIYNFLFKSWISPGDTPTPRIALLQLILKIEQARESFEKTPITIHCMDGASQSGLLAACIILHEKLLREKLVDVYHVIKSIKSKRAPFINSYAQYSFCLNFLLDVMNKPAHFESN